MRSWRGTHDVDRRPERPLPAVIVLGSERSRVERFVAESLGDAVDWRLAETGERLGLLERELGTDRLILLDPEWNMALVPSTVCYSWSNGRIRVIRPAEQSHPRLFAVTWEGDNWNDPWEEEGSFEVRDPNEDRDLLRRHVVA